jgi:type I restriction enzyme, S subunit
MKNISQDRFLSLRVAIPPLAEQRSIVSISADMEAAVQRTQRLIDLKTRLKAALAERLLTSRLRFREFSGRTWQARRLGDVFAERAEAARSELPLLAVTTNNGVVLRETLARRDTSSTDRSRYLRAAPGDIAYNTLRMWQGVSGLVRTEGLVSPDYTVCAAKEGIESRFASHLFKLPSQIELFKRYSQGLTSDRWRLRFPNLARIPSLLPERDEQTRIADMLDLMDREIDLLRRQLDLLKKQKQGLLEKLLSGEVRVKEPPDGAPGD